MSQISFVGTYFPLRWKYHSITIFFPSLSLIFHLFQSTSYSVALKIINNFLFSSPVTPVSEYLYYSYISFTKFISWSHPCVYDAMKRDGASEIWEELQSEYGEDSPKGNKGWVYSTCLSQSTFTKINNVSACGLFKLQQDRLRLDTLKDFLSIDFVCGYKMSSESCRHASPWWWVRI